ncbi:MAG TPA: N-acetylmuramoyl-L-alanine amidase, partial [Steroidobacteraceae bacterium]|nr:N-acetylmuramoyl-L-alanine amidase [Steroidobacteraceae bacterium]
MCARLARWITPWFLALAVSAGVAPAQAAPTARVTDVRLWSGPEGTRLVLELSGPVRHEVFTLENPDRVVIDLANAELAAGRHMPTGQGPVKSVRAGPQAGRGLRLVLDLRSKQEPRSFAVGPDGSSGHRLVVELPPAGGAAATAASVAPASNPPPAASVAAATLASQPGVTGAQPVKTIASTVKGRDLVIAVDAGHGGQDPGAIGRGGTREKDVTLAIARKLAALIDAEPGMRAVLIRDGDYFVTLGGRTRKARELGADMFVSVHADSVRSHDVRGSSVYVLSLRGASDEAARWL